VRDKEVMWFIRRQDYVHTIGNSTAFSDYQISSSLSISHGYNEHNIKDERRIYLTLTTAKII
jgi:hypothetical protein